MSVRRYFPSRGSAGQYRDDYDQIEEKESSPASGTVCWAHEIDRVHEQNGEPDEDDIPPKRRVWATVLMVILVAATGTGSA